MRSSTSTRTARRDVPLHDARPVQAHRHRQVRGLGSWWCSARSTGFARERDTSCCNAVRAPSPRCIGSAAISRRARRRDLVTDDGGAPEPSARMQPADRRVLVAALESQVGRGVELVERRCRAPSQRCRGPSRRRRARSSSSSRISPTTSSAMSSKVTMPAKPPCSSTTTASCRWSARICSRTRGERSARRHDGRVGHDDPTVVVARRSGCDREHLGDACDTDDVVAVAAGDGEARPAAVEQADEVGHHGVRVDRRRPGRVAS